MKKLKLIITFILLVSLFLGIVSCTPAEESKAESTGDVSEDVSDAVSEEPGTDVSFIDADKEPFDESIGEISDDQLVLKLQNGKMKILDRYIDGEALSIVEISIFRNKRDELFKNRFSYDPKEAYYAEDADFDKIRNDMSSFLGDLRREIIMEFYDEFSIEEDEFSYKEAYIFHWEGLIINDWFSEITYYPSIPGFAEEYYRIWFVVTLSEDEIERINEKNDEAYNINYFAGPLWNIFNGSPSERYSCPTQGSLD